MRKNFGVGIIGNGHVLASNIETNEDLCLHFTDVTPAWIEEKTGIKQRYIAGDNDSASEFAINAAKMALEHANVVATDLGLIIVCTFSGDYIFPPVSAKVHKELGAARAQTFDVQANCAGFVTGLTLATDRMFMDETIKYALVIGVELPSRYRNLKDANSAIYLSDGAGAAILGRVEPGSGILASDFHTDSSAYEAVRLCGGGSSFPAARRSAPASTDFMEMNGLATWKQAVTHLPVVTKLACAKGNVAVDSVDLFLFHQANLNLIHYVVRKMGQGLEKTYTNVERIGNTGAASLAIVLSEAVHSGRINPGDNVVLAGVGAGFSFGASVWRWYTRRI